MAGTSYSAVSNERRKRKKPKTFLKFLWHIFEKGKAALARIFFIIHGMITVWRVTDVYSDPLFFLLCIPMALLIVEFFVTTKFTDGEWKW